MSGYFTAANYNASGVVYKQLGSQHSHVVHLADTASVDLLL